MTYLYVERGSQKRLLLKSFMINLINFLVRGVVLQLAILLPNSTKSQP